MTHLMPRFISCVRVALVLTMASLGVCALASTSGAAPRMVAAPGDTALPAGWELCVLQGVTAPATPANVDDLDEWQAAEGGSTNNSAAYNPFNTLRTTDVNNAAHPGRRHLFERLSRLPDVVGGLCRDRGHAAPTEHVVHHRCTAGRERGARGRVPGRRRPEPVVRTLGRRYAVLRGQDPRVSRAGSPPRC